MKFTFIFLFFILIMTVGCENQIAANKNNPEEVSDSTETQRPFITTWKTDNPGSSDLNQITIPTEGFGYNYHVDCDSDGILEAENQTTDYTCTYDTPGIYNVSITGEFPAIYFDHDKDTINDSEKLLTVDKWGDIAWRTMNGAFSGCTNLTIAAADAPDLSQVTDISRMFEDAKVFNTDIGHWDVSNITDMHWLFYGAESFNQDINGWDVSQVTDMSAMFHDAKTFNQPIGTWDVSNVKDMYGMFGDAESFNQDITGWDVSYVITMHSMFDGAKQFNQPIGTWDTSHVTDMYCMFQFAESFNKNIGDWDVSNVTDMSGMFNNAGLFNSYIGDWDVTNVKEMNFMFHDAESFNQDIGAWDTSNVQLMNQVFKNASAFNQDISSWNVSGVSTFNEMFFQAEMFDRDLSNWNVSAATNLTSMFHSVTLSTEHYDALLNAWSLLSVHKDLVFDGGKSTYCIAEKARQKLIDEFNWTISDGGKFCE